MSARLKLRTSAVSWFRWVVRCSRRYRPHGQLVAVLLRPGNAHAARSAKIVLGGLIRRIKARLPHLHITVRADSGFCVPRVLDLLERLDRELGDIDEVIGIAKNPRLLALAPPGGGM